MTPTVLFLCPHGAAKSVLAAAYCQQLADQAGLNFDCTFAGTEPDAQISPAVIKLLQSEGIDVANDVPRRITREELSAAFHVISLGCDLGDLQWSGITVERWDDVPPVSQNLPAARNSIRAHVKELVAKLKQAGANAGI
jgi:protein-tyrosine-phosphatase